MKLKHLILLFISLSNYILPCRFLHCLLASVIVCFCLIVNSAGVWPSSHSLLLTIHRLFSFLPLSLYSINLHCINYCHLVRTYIFDMVMELFPWYQTIHIHMPSPKIFKFDMKIVNEIVNTSYCEGVSNFYFANLST